MCKSFQLIAATFILCTVALITKQSPHTHTEFSFNYTNPKVCTYSKLGDGYVD